MLQLDPSAINEEFSQSKTQFLNLNTSSKSLVLNPMNSTTQAKKNINIKTAYNPKPNPKTDPKSQSLPKTIPDVSIENPTKPPEKPIENVESKENKEKTKPPEPIKEEFKKKVSLKENLKTMTEKEIKQKIDNLKQEQNHEMLMVLQEEQLNEANREELLRKTIDSKDRKKLETISALKRGKALSRIQELSAYFSFTIIKI